MRDLDRALAKHFHPDPFLQAGQPLSGLPQCDAIRQPFHRQWLVVGLVGADDILGRMPEPVPPAQIEPMITLLVGRTFEEKVSGPAGERAQ